MPSTKLTAFPNCIHTGVLTDEHLADIMCNRGELVSYSSSGECTYEQYCMLTMTDKFPNLSRTCKRSLRDVCDLL